MTSAPSPSPTLMLHPDAPDAAEPFRAEIAALKAAPLLSDLAVRLTEVAEDQRERLLAALDGDRLRRTVGLTLQVQQLLPTSTPAQVGRDVAFLRTAVPVPDPEHEGILLRHLADPGDRAWKQVYADFLEERGDPRAAAVRAEVFAVEAGMPPDAVCGVLDAERHLAVAYTPEHLAALGVMPFSPETLRQCKDTHVLVAGATLSIEDIHLFTADEFDDTDNWYHNESFANNWKVHPRWYLLRKDPVPQSFSKTHAEQTALLTAEEEVPRACEMTYMAILHWLTHGERLLHEVCVRCKDGGMQDLHRVSVGFFDKFEVEIPWNGVRREYLGLASSRKPSSPARSRGE